MAKIVPFRGLRYNPDQIRDLATVMAPPYDLISPALQNELYARHPYNVVRLTLGKTGEQDDDSNNRYSRAAADFAQWQQDRILVRDSAPSIYLYDQEFCLEKGETVVRKGVVALSRLEEFSSGVVKPHEKTLAEPKADRFRLIKACSANLSPIFSLYSDPCCVLDSLTKKLKERDPDLEVTDDEKVIHRLWQISDPDIIDKAQDLLASKPLFIADGHHRYETALNYRNYMRERHPEFSGKELFNYVLMYFANMEERGMRIFPTHRLIFNLEGFEPESFRDALSEYFVIESMAIDPADPGTRRQVQAGLRDRGRKQHCLALFAGGRQVYYLSLRDAGVMDRFFEEKTPKTFRSLDVNILHRLILENLLNISPEAQERQTHLRYVNNLDEPFELVERGEFQLAFLMNPTRLNEVRDVANAGGKMPQKSTCFYPKLLSGLVINKIVEDEKVE